MSNILNFSCLSDIIKGYKKIVIVSHANPDGDALGSSLALYLFLKKLGADSKVIVPNDYPTFLAWMPFISDVIVYDKNKMLAYETLKDAELFCYLDFNTESRTGVMHNDLCHFATTPKVLIDHHLEPDLSKYKAAVSEINVSSTSELVAEFIKYHGFENYLDKDIATCLLVGIITDTGSFAHSVNLNTFSICGDLLSTSIDYRQIHQNIYDNSTEDRLRLLGFLINDRLTVLNEYNTAYIYATKSDLESYNYQVGDTEGVVNYPLSIDNIRMSVLITEKQGVIRFSFRSKGDFSVNDLARKYFEGGGHRNAAGGTLTCSLEEAIQKLLSVLPEYKNLLTE